MPWITYIEASGQEHVVDVEIGTSVMEGARNSGVPGIDAVCGGVCSCATCHVFVAFEWLDRLEPVSSMEDEMLDCVEDRAAESRLSCQIVVRDDLDGLIVRLPSSQG